MRRAPSARGGRWSNGNGSSGSLVGGKAAREADLFFADLMGFEQRPAGVPAAARSGTAALRRPAAGRAWTAHRVFDELAQREADESLLPAEIRLDELAESNWQVVARPGSLTAAHGMQAGDLVVRRALGEGRLTSLLVLGEDIERAELYGRAGRIRPDTLVLRAAVPAMGEVRDDSTSETVPTCRSTRPTDPGQLIIDTRAIPAPGLRIRNWASADVGQFQVPAAASAECRAANAIQAIVLHETVFPPPWRDSRRLNMQNRRDDQGRPTPVSVQAFVDGDGSIVQTNDFVDKMHHGSTANATSIGFEIVNNMTPVRAGSEPAGQEPPFSNGWFQSEYVPPLRPQLEAMMAMIELLTDGSRGHGLNIPLAFPDIQDGVFVARRALTPARLDAAERQMRGIYGPRRGIFAHASFQSNKQDGVYPVLYCWLRLLGRDAGQRIDHAAASRICRELLSAATLRWEGTSSTWHGRNLSEMRIDVRRYDARAPVARPSSSPRPSPVLQLEDLSEAAAPPTNCFDISVFRSMDLTADGAIGLAAAATATTPPSFTLGAATRFRTIAGLDTNFAPELAPTANPVEFLEITPGRRLLDTGHFRVDPGDATRFQVRVRGLACHPSRPGSPNLLPEGTERLPVVILVHGNHDDIKFDLADSGRARRTTSVLTSAGPIAVTFIPARATLRHEVASFRGYRYLQDHLARLGMVSVSIDTNAANHLDSLIRFRADLVLEMLDHLRSLDATAGSPFHNRLDFSKTALVGHSRGGDAVVMAAVLNASRPAASRCGIRAVVAISPTDFTGLLSPASARLELGGDRSASFLCVYGSHDGDVSGAFPASQRSQAWTFAGTGFRHYDRAKAQRAMVFIHGATHNRFNSVWINPADHEAGSPARTLAESQADNGVDAPSVDPRRPPSTTFPLPAGSRDARVLSAAAHQTLAREYVGGWLELWLQRQFAQQRLFIGAQANSLSTPVALEWKLGRNLDSIDVFDDPNPALNVPGGPITSPPFVRERLMELSALAQVPHHDQVLQADVPTGAARTYRTELPAAKRNWSAFSALTFRISKSFPDVSTPAAIAAASFPPSFEIALFDGTTRKSVDQTAVAPLNPLTVRPYHRLSGADNLTKVHLQTWQVPLAQFTGTGGVNLTTIRAVEITFNAAASEPIHLDTLSLVTI